MTQRLAKTELFAKWLGGTLAVDNQGVTTGRRVYVSSDTGTDAGGYGANPDAPVATWDYAVGLCTANQHDIIYIMPGHTETLTNSSRVTLDMAGVRSIGLGSGTDRPTFTFTTDTTADVLVSSANNTIENMIFVNGVNNQAEMIDVDATDCTIRNCEFRQGASTSGQDMIGINGGAANACNRAHVVDCIFKAPSSGNDDAAIELGEVADGVIVEGCLFFGDWDEAAIHNPTGKVLTNLSLINNIVSNLQTGIHAIELVSACTGVAVGNMMYGDTQGTILDPGSLKCLGNYEVDAVDQAGIPVPGLSAAPWPDYSFDANTFATDAITADKIADYAVLAVNIGTDAIDANKIADYAILAINIATDAITSAKIAADAIGASEIADYAIDAAAIATDAITADKVADYAILAVNLGTDAIDANKIADYAILAINLATDAITADKIAADAIGASEIADYAIDANALATDAITADKIADYAILAVNIATDAITANKIADYSILAINIATDAITSDKIADYAIPAISIATDALTADKIADDAFSEEHFDEAATQLLGGGGIRVDRATADVLTGGAVNLYTISTGRVLMLGIIGEVTTQIQAALCNAQFITNSTAGGTTNLCATLDLTGDAVGTTYGITGEYATALVAATGGGAPFPMCPLVLEPGVLTFSTGQDVTGSIKFSIWYVPLDAGATVTAA